MQLRKCLGFKNLESSINVARKRCVLKEVEIAQVERTQELLKKQRDDLKDNAAIVTKEMARLLEASKEQLERLSQEMAATSNPASADPHAPRPPKGSPTDLSRAADVQSAGIARILEKFEAMEKRLERLERKLGDGGELRSR
jgi:hypothetical protein